MTLVHQIDLEQLIHPNLALTACLQRLIVTKVFFSH